MGSEEGPVYTQEHLADFRDVDQRREYERGFANGFFSGFGLAFLVAAVIISFIIFARHL